MTSTFTTAKGSDSCEAVTSRKVEREEIERLLKQARREVARKIFAELDKECILGAGRKKRHCSGCYLVLKAKYLEEGE